MSVFDDHTRDPPRNADLDVNSAPPQVSEKDLRKAARDDGKERGDMMREYLYTSTTGMEVGVGIALGAIVGWWLDGKYDTAPYGVLTGLVLGVLHAARRLWGLVKRELAKDAAETAMRAVNEPSTPNADIERDSNQNDDDGHRP